MISTGNNLTSANRVAHKDCVTGLIEHNTSQDAEHQVIETPTGGPRGLYNESKEVKKSAKNDRGAFVEMLAGKAELAAPRKFRENQPGQRSEEPLNRVGRQARRVQHHHEGPSPELEYPATPTVESRGAPPKMKMFYHQSDYSVIVNNCFRFGLSC